MQQPQALSLQLNAELADARDVTTWSVKAGNGAQFDWINAPGENDWKRRGCCLGRDRRRGGTRYDPLHPAANQFSRQSRQLVISAVRPPIFDKLTCYIASR